MARTPISRHLVHDASAVSKDAEILTRLCDIASEVALPYARQALEHETEDSAARLLSMDAASLLKELLVDQNVDEAEIQAIEKSLANSLKSDSVEPDDEEIRRHARASANAVVTSWLQVLLDKRDKDISLTALHLLPTDENDTSSEWSELWLALAPYAMDRSQVFEILCGFCEQLLDDETMTKDSRVLLPQRLELEEPALRQALSISESFRLTNWLRTQIEEFKKRGASSRTFGLPALADPSGAKRTKLSTATAAAANSPQPVEFLLGSTRYKCSPLRGVGLEQAVIQAMLDAQSQVLADENHKHRAMMGADVSVSLPQGLLGIGFNSRTVKVQG